MEAKDHNEGLPRFQVPRLSPPRWLRNPHLQTLWPKFFRRRPQLPLQRERLELSDGDFIDLAWVKGGQGAIVLMLHGLEGNLHSHYALPILATLAESGFRPVFMHLRGCSGEPNRLARTYHSGAVEDLAEVLALLKDSGRPVAAAIGFSLGGNLLLRYLGLNGKHALLRTAMAVSVPFVLGDAARRLEQGPSRIYQRYLMNRLKQSYSRKFVTMPSPIQVDLDRIHTLWQYDQQITAPLNGFAGADDYYARCSSIHYLPGITVPTLILHSLDDPFMYPHNVPTPDQVGPGVQLAIQPHGGHVGFVERGMSWRGDSLIDRLAPAFFHGHLGRAIGSV
jgi:predicted alpha/beta-fold hydrolase